MNLDSTTVITASHFACGCVGCTVLRGRNTHAALRQPRIKCEAYEEPKLYAPREGRPSRKRRHSFLQYDWSALSFYAL